MDYDQWVEDVWSIITSMECVGWCGKKKCKNGVEARRDEVVCVSLERGVTRMSRGSTDEVTDISYTNLISIETSKLASRYHI